jgi:hypothetical protein
VSALVRRSFRLLVLSLLVLSGCRYHVAEDGDWALTPTGVLRDDCGLDGTDPVGALTLRTEGHQVSLALARPGLTLQGTYRYGTEDLTADGVVVNYPTTVNGRACLLETAAFHLDATASSPTAMRGTMSIAYETRQDDACVCRYWFSFDAQRR